MKKKTKEWDGFKESRTYLGENKNYLYLVLILFLASIVSALIFSIPESLAEQIKQLLREIIEKTEGLGAIELIVYIFLNNLWVSLLGLFLGIFFCVIPVVLVITNGYVIGFVIKMMIEDLGLQDGIISLWRLFPHGIFELPAVIISLAIGVKLGFSTIEALNKNSFKILRYEIKKAIRVLFRVIIPLLLVAAVIEGILIALVG